MFIYAAPSPSSNIARIVSCFICESVPLGILCEAYLISACSTTSERLLASLSVTSCSANGDKKKSDKNGETRKERNLHRTVALHNSHNSYCHRRFSDFAMFFCPFSSVLCCVSVFFFGMHFHSIKLQQW